jgi:hypothetical protein
VTRSKNNFCRFFQTFLESECLNVGSTIEETVV